MTTGAIGKRSGNAIVPLANVTQKTKVVTQSEFLVTATNWTTAYARVWCESDSNGVYKLFGTVEGDFSSPVTALYFTLTTNVTFADIGIGGQTCQVDIKDAGGVGCSDELEIVRCLRNSTGIYIDVTSVTDVSSVLINFGGVILASKPSWFDDNAENLSDVSAYIPPASDSEAGIVSLSDQTMGAGVKTFSDGVKPSSGSDALTSYKEDTFTPTLSIGTNITAVTNSYSKYTKIGNYVYCSCEVSVTFSATGDAQFTFPISDLPFVPYDYDMVFGLIGIRGAGSNTGRVWGYSGGTVYCSLAANPYTGARSCIMTFSYMTS